MSYERNERLFNELSNNKTLKVKFNFGQYILFGHVCVCGLTGHYSSTAGCGCDCRKYFEPIFREPSGRFKVKLNDIVAHNWSVCCMFAVHRWWLWRSFLSVELQFICSQINVYKYLFIFYHFVWPFDNYRPRNKKWLSPVLLSTIQSENSHYKFAWKLHIATEQVLDAYRCLTPDIIACPAFIRIHISPFGTRFVVLVGPLVRFRAIHVHLDCPKLNWVGWMV